MDRKWLKWTLIASWIFVIPAIISILVYMLVPPIISILIGSPISGSCGSAILASTGAQSSLTTAIMDLCSGTRNFVGILVMILIIIAAIPCLISYVIASIEVYRSKMTSLRKGIWLVLFWLILGIFAVTGYYFTDRKKL